MACRGPMLREAHAVCLEQGMASVSSRPRHEIIWPVCTSREREGLWHRETRAGETAEHRDHSVSRGEQAGKSAQEPHWHWCSVSSFPWGFASRASVLSWVLSKPLPGILSGAETEKTEPESRWLCHGACRWQPGTDPVGEPLGAEQGVQKALICQELGLAAAAWAGRTELPPLSQPLLLSTVIWRLIFCVMWNQTAPAVNLE